MQSIRETKHYMVVTSDLYIDLVKNKSLFKLGNTTTGIVPGSDCGVIAWTPSKQIPGQQKMPLRAIFWWPTRDAL